MVKNEEWKLISSIENNIYYYVSNHGRILRKEHYILKQNQYGFHKTKQFEKILKNYLRSDGYLRTKIKGKNILVHIIVANEFIIKKNKKMKN